MKKGFSLIELIVVVAIIAILTAIVVRTLSASKARARDAERISDLGRLSSALGLYYANAGHYPVTSGTWYLDCQQTGNWIPDSGNYAWNAGYLSTESHDPQPTCIQPQDNTNQSPTAAYAYWSDDGQRYALAARLEGTSDTIGVTDKKWFDGTWLYAQDGWQGHTYVIFNK